jgi:hypothetical protein
MIAYITIQKDTGMIFGAGDSPEEALADADKWVEFPEIADFHGDDFATVLAVLPNIKCMDHIYGDSTYEEFKP